MLHLHPATLRAALPVPLPGLELPQVSDTLGTLLGALWNTPGTATVTQGTPSGAGIILVSPRGLILAL